MDTFGQRLRQLRERRRLSQRALAEQVGVSRETITRLEADRLEPKTGLAMRLEQALEADPGTLVYPTPAELFPDGVLDFRPVLRYCTPEGQKFMLQLVLGLAKLLQDAVT